MCPASLIHPNKPRLSISTYTMEHSKNFKMTNLSTVFDLLNSTRPTIICCIRIKLDALRFGVGNMAIVSHSYTPFTTNHKEMRHTTKEFSKLPVIVSFPLYKRHNWSLEICLPEVRWSLSTFKIRLKVMPHSYLKIHFMHSGTSYAVNAGNLISRTPLSKSLYSLA